jgi:riboflavin biosynthesis pyrimidine reductase
LAPNLGTFGDGYPSFLSCFGGVDGAPVRHLQHGFEYRWPHLAESVATARYRRKLYEQVHSELAGDAWLVGRVTGQEFAKATAYADHSQSLPHTSWFASRDASSYAVVLDASGKIAWGRSDIGGDPIVAVLTESVSEQHLAGPQKDKVSYLFAGETNVDLGHALEILNQELGVKRVLLEGGGIVNGSFSRAGLVDEISLIIWPVIDGAAGAPCVFDSTPEDANRATRIRAMQLLCNERRSVGSVWLRYRVGN